MPIKIYADENVSAKVIDGLRRYDVDVESSLEIGHVQYPDEKHLDYAIKHERAIFTHDSDFLIAAQRLAEIGKTHFGIIYIHPKYATVGKCVRGIKLIVDILEKYEMINQVEFL